MLLVWPVLAWLGGAGREVWQARVAEAGSAAICGFGLFWFATRALG